VTSDQSQQEKTMSDRVKQLCEALKAVMDAIDANPRLSFASERKSEILSMDDVQELSDNGEYFLGDPVGYGHRKSVRKIGSLLAEFHPEKMRDIAEKAASAGGRYYVRADIIDKNWDGLKMSNGDIWARFKEISDGV
jgi:hypothetical protein